MGEKKQEEVKKEITPIDKELEIKRANQAVPTIMPTMLEEVEDMKGVTDISSIIPQGEGNASSGSDLLISREKELKSDGCIVVANMDKDGNPLVSQNFAMPEQIDIEQRKAEAASLKNKKKIRKKKKLSKLGKKIQNSTALVSLIVIICLVAFFIFIKNAPTEEDFVPLHVQIELGEKLPIRTADYVKPGRGKIDEILYKLDTSNVKIEETGDYEFTVTYKGITKKGIITIADTKEPFLETRKVVITEGDSYDPSSFVESCIDLSGCNYSFLDANTVSKFTTPGIYTVQIVATDAYQNFVTKKASLIIEVKGKIKKYAKYTDYNPGLGFEIAETYDLHFDSFTNESLLIDGKHEIVYQYRDAKKYQEALKEYSGEANYTSIDQDMIIKKVETVSVVGSNYSTKTDIDNYLTKEGFVSIK